MGRYQFQEQEKMNEHEVHPAWRGIGCLIILLVPALSYAGASVLLGIPSVAQYVPREFFGRPTLPDIFWQVPVLDSIASGLYQMNNLSAKLFLAGLLLVLISGFIAVIYPLMYRVIGPPRRKSPRPPRRKIKKYKR